MDDKSLNLVLELSDEAIDYLIGRINERSEALAQEAAVQEVKQIQEREMRKYCVDCKSYLSNRERHSRCDTCGEYRGGHER